MKQTSPNTHADSAVDAANGSISIWLNGKRTRLQSPALTAVLAQFTPPFAVAINSEFISRQHYDSTELCSGDKVDIVSPIAGG